MALKESSPFVFFNFPVQELPVTEGALEVEPYLGAM